MEKGNKLVFYIAPSRGYMNKEIYAYYRSQNYFLLDGLKSFGASEEELTHSMAYIRRADIVCINKNLGVTLPMQVLLENSKKLKKEIINFPKLDIKNTFIDMYGYIMENIEIPIKGKDEKKEKEYWHKASSSILRNVQISDEIPITCPLKSSLMIAITNFLEERYKKKVDVKKKEVKEGFRIALDFMNEQYSKSNNDILLKAEELKLEENSLASKLVDASIKFLIICQYQNE